MYGLLVQLGQQCSRTKLQSWYCQLFQCCHLRCGAQKLTKCLVVAVCGANVEAGSIGSFTAVTEYMYLNVDNIGAGNLPVYLDL